VSRVPLMAVREPVRIGVMGCAAIALRRVLPAMTQSADFELVAVASREQARADDFAREFGAVPVAGYEALLGRHDLDAVYVPLPTGLHEEWVERSLDAGLHVLVEKSFTDDLQVARRLTDLARERGLLLMENFMFLHHSQHARIAELVEGGAIGDVRALRSSFGFPPLDRSGFRYDPGLGGGCLIDAGTYTLRAARLHLRDEGLQVKSATLYTDPELGIDLYGGAMLEARPGVTAQLAFGFDNFYQCSIELWGSEGKLVADRAFTAHPGQVPGLTLHRDSGVEQVELAADDHFTNLLSEFARALRERDHGRHHRDLVEQARLLEEVRRCTAV